MPSLLIKHNIEVAHRLFLQPGKCRNIHGHSMWVELLLVGEVDDKGFLGSIDFSDAKKLFRGYLDTTFDHGLLLNKEDPWTAHFGIETDMDQLPGLSVCDGDPTTENIARWIQEWAEKEPLFTGLVGVAVKVMETSVNGVIYP